MFTGKTCPLYAPPKNGALACLKIGSDRYCAVMCKSGFNFVFDPPFLYFCSGGVWNYYALPGQVYDTTLPWPDCSSKLIITDVD